ncbi:hypothetical protein EDD53_0967 [Pacificibacter maritimus]|uniref:Uncharacterized protein n=1 Tax=Pacificibacter maritimus TaxID=762213 RepID=A0A3N4V402_9RHOB|nr:hypothetical protein [Pacificibacter maritimus]RPE71837.1 hypothetical protein EDD53_0967 [Pacificibacter maritimus]
MTDLFGVQAVSGGGTIRSNADLSVPAVPKVAEATHGGDTGDNQKANLPRQTGESGSKTIAQDQSGPYEPKPVSDTNTPREDYDPNMLTGPTPSFQASVLEVESDLRNIIAQVEAKRAITLDEAAIAPVVSPQTVTGFDGKTTDESRPTEHRNARQDRPEIPAISENIDTNLALSPSPVSSEAQDREAAYAGPSATLVPPYRKSTSSIDDMS